MKETPFYFGGGPPSLFGVLHEPAAAPTSVFVFCHPFGEEKLWAHRVFVWFARALSSEGHAVLRFDYAGNGDSEGDFSQSSLTTACADVSRAITEARRRTGATQVNLLGLRLGATVASLVAEEESAGVDRLVLWAPVVDGARYMQELLRINLTTQMSVYGEVRRDRTALVESFERGNTVNVDGYEVSFPLYSQVSAISLAAGPKRHAGPCLIVHVDRNAGSESAELRALAATYLRATVAVAQEDPFWKEIARSYQRPASNLFKATLDWLALPA
jgi:exosortase A-associated hydrolase 2